ncbi:hypothetical protein HaLaN_27045 [Haematococcus lacustris]|uniref:Ubiquitin-like domain-containing protein n=1 Tax=Haematococcus lacustris TaxID=44745 RepID=A0A6A0A7M4_HAELA|nr:hypothetical protein HaLaN_27045 [Haematococcus lacustris]
MQLTGVYEGREVTVSASPSDTLASLRAKLLDDFGISNWQADQYTVADLMSGLVTRGARALGLCRGPDLLRLSPGSPWRP